MELHHGNQRSEAILTYTVRVLERHLVVGNASISYDQLPMFQQLKILVTDAEGTWLQSSKNISVKVAIPGVFHDHCISILMKLFKTVSNVFDRYALPALWTNIIHPHQIFCCNNDDSYARHKFNTASSTIIPCVIHASNEHHFHHHHHYYNGAILAAAEDVETTPLPSTSAAAIASPLPNQTAPEVTPVRHKRTRASMKYRERRRDRE